MLKRTVSFMLFYSIATVLLLQNVLSAQVKESQEAFRRLASQLRSRFPEQDLTSISKAFSRLSTAQKTFKGIDGLSHEAYQRTHSNSVEGSTGRAARSAGRAVAVACGLEACEYVEGLVEDCILNATVRDDNVLVYHDEDYSGAAGADYGGLDSTCRGRLVIVVTYDIPNVCKALDQEPMKVRMGRDLITVQPSLYQLAGQVLEEVEAVIREHASSSNVAIHCVGHGLGGGIASIMAAILNGALELPPTQSDEDKSSSEPSLLGFATRRVSAVSLGGPPCISTNVQASYILSILFGDDVVCRLSKKSLDRLTKRTQRALKWKGVMSKVNQMRNTVSMAASGLQRAEETRLAIPGRAYLVRPRRLDRACSIHEVGSLLNQDGLRANVLWQLNDVLLTKSMWKHHELTSYIHGLDRVNLRSVGGDESEA